MILEAAIAEYEAVAAQLDAVADRPEQLLELLDAHEERLRFAMVDLDLTWRIGGALREMGSALRLPIAISVILGQQRAFHAALTGATADNDGWAARKTAVVQRYGRSSLAVGTQFKAEGKTFEADSRLPISDFAAHGGALPLLVGQASDALAGKRTSALPVGVVVVSGLPQRHDHALVVAGLSVMLR